MGANLENGNGSKLQQLSGYIFLLDGLVNTNKAAVNNTINVYLFSPYLLTLFHSYFTIYKDVWFAQWTIRFKHWTVQYN